MNSEFERLRDHRLYGWGAWGRQDTDRPNPEAVGYSICADYLPEAGDYEGEAPPTFIYINQRDAEYLDGFIRQLENKHKQIIRMHYYLQQKRWDQLDAAVRSLMDKMDANRATVQRMRALGA